VLRSLEGMAGINDFISVIELEGTVRMTSEPLTHGNVV
jgi:hypothetical protein